jgi:hypothetical protein
LFKRTLRLYAKGSRLRSKTGQVFRADAAYIALTMDVICQYSFAADDGYLLGDDFKIEWKYRVTQGE